MAVNYETIKSIERLAKSFGVQVIMKNGIGWEFTVIGTKWKRKQFIDHLENHIKEKGDHFSFYELDNLKGFNEDFRYVYGDDFIEQLHRNALNTGP